MFDKENVILVSIFHKRISNLFHSQFVLFSLILAIISLILWSAQTWITGADFGPLRLRFCRLIRSGLKSRLSDRSFPFLRTLHDGLRMPRGSMAKCSSLELPLRIQLFKTWRWQQFIGNLFERPKFADVNNLSCKTD